MIANFLRLPNSGPAPPPDLSGVVYLTFTVCCCRQLDKYLGKSLGLDTSRPSVKSAWPKDSYDNLTEEEMNRRIEEEISKMSTEELEAELKKHEEEYPLSEPLDRSKAAQSKRPPIQKDERDNDDDGEDDDDDEEEGGEDDDEEEGDIHENESHQKEVPKSENHGANKSTFDEATYRAMKASFESSSFVKPWLEFEASKLKKR